MSCVVVGEHPRNGGKDDIRATDGEGWDVASLDLTGDQEALIKASPLPANRS